ncbi:hypothetical protein MBLNU230_g3714t1 [Neophaeotheca triangularis]
MASSDTSANVPMHGDADYQPHNIRLACQACQRRKIKCDRTFPCGQCQRSHLTCESSSRKQRARKVNRQAVDSHLKDRIAKLEALVEALSGEVDCQDKDSAVSPTTDDGSTTSPTISPRALAQRYIGSDFWADICFEVQSLRDALEEDGSEDEQDSYSATSDSQQQEFGLFVSPPGIVHVMPGAIQEPTSQQVGYLCDAYCANVDRVLKFCYAPMLRDFLKRGAPYLGLDALAPSNRALKSAVCFAALTSWSDKDVRSVFGVSKQEQMSLFRRWVDVSFAQVDLFNTSDLAAVQAMTAYAATAKMFDTTRRPWTMLALIVRIARAMNLHHEASTASPFIRELRHRLWHTIRFLDLYHSMDRGSELMISANSYTTPPPCSIDDADFGPESTHLTPREGLTEICVLNTAQAAVSALEQLSQNPPPIRKGVDIWQERLDLAKRTGEWIERNILQYCDPNDPWERTVIGLGMAMSKSTILRAVRPVARPYQLASSPPRVESPWLLRFATDSLRSTRIVYEETQTRWNWMVWVPWYTLAVALAGLCAIRDTEASRQAWLEVEVAYQRYPRHIADGEGGMLWRPIQKLYRRAAAFRDETDTNAMTSTDLATLQNQTAGPRADSLRLGEDIDYPMQRNNYSKYRPSNYLINNSYTNNFHINNLHTNNFHTTNYLTTNYLSTNYLTTPHRPTNNPPSNPKRTPSHTPQQTPQPTPTPTTQHPAPSPSTRPQQPGSPNNNNNPNPNPQC